MSEIVIEQEEQVDQEQDEQQEQAEEAQQEGGEPEQEEEIVVTIGEQQAEKPEEHESSTFRELRTQLREAKKRLKDYEVREKTQEPIVNVGEKPTLEACGFDDTKYEAELASWFERKRQADERQRKIEEEQRAANEAWQAKLNTYANSRTQLKVKDFDDAESTVQETFNQTQQAILLHTKNPALVIYALGKNPSKAKELAQIKDNVSFAIAVGELGKEIQMKPKGKPPAPEKVVTGTGSLAGATDRTLDQLRSEAEKSGDYSKVIAYKNQLRNKK